jgi:N-methylhydantoinase A
VSLARALGVKKVVVPRHPGLFSALGMLAADIVKDYAATVMIDGEKAESGGLETRFEALEDRAVRELSREGATPGNVRLERFVDMRYLGQSFELTTPYVPNLSAAFHVLYEKTYGYKNPDKPVQAVTVRLRATGLAGRPVLERIGARAAKGGMPPVLERRDVTCGGRPMPAAICDRAGLVPGHVLPGPAVIVEPSATTFLPPGAEAGVDGLGNLVIDPEAG